MLRKYTNALCQNLGLLLHQLKNRNTFVHRSGFERDRAQPYPSGREQRGRGRGSFSSGLGGPPHPPDVDRESMRDMYREIYREAYLQAYRDLYRDIASRDAARDARQSLSQEIPSTSRESGGDPYRRPPPEYYDRYHNL